MDILPGLPADFDPNTLYEPDGAVNHEAVEALIDLYGPGPEPEIDDGLSSTVNSFSTDIELSSIFGTTPPEDDVRNPPARSLEHALGAYVAHMITAGMEFEHPSGPINPALLSNPYHKLSLSDELTRYYDDYLSGSQKVRYATLQELSENLTPPKVDAQKLECVVAIPLAGHQECKNIYHTLEQFTKQDMDNDAFEVILYLNLPGRDGENDGMLSAELQKTLEEIQRFRQAYPSVNVRNATTTYRINRAPIGKIRSDLWDLVGYDLKQRGRENDILVISADADIIHLNRHYLSSMVAARDQTGADMVAASLRWQSAEGLPYDSTVNRMLRWQTFLDSLRDNHSETLHTADANTGISLAMYIASGGYNRERELGEMSDLAWRIRLLRADPQDKKHYIPVKTVETKARNAVLKTHSRRLIEAMALGHAPYDAWDQRLIKFGADDKLRTAEMRSTKAEEQARKHWKKWMLNKTKLYTAEVPLEKRLRVLKAARRILGFSGLYEDQRFDTN